jgi:virulence-associated protein VapD
MKQERQGLESQKCIMFDLNVNAIKSAIINGEAKFKSYTTAYDKIRRYLEKGGFEHEQGSGYTSKNPMSVEDVQNVFFTLGEKNPWLASCMSKCRLSSFEEGALKYTDLMQDIKDGANSAKGAQGEGLVSVPNNYNPTKDPREKEREEALRKTLRGEEIKLSPSSPTQAPGAVNSGTAEPLSPIKTKAPLPKGKGKGKNDGAGM